MSLDIFVGRTWLNYSTTKKPVAFSRHGDGSKPSLSPFRFGASARRFGDGCSSPGETELFQLKPGTIFARSLGMFLTGTTWVWALKWSSTVCNLDISMLTLMHPHQNASMWLGGLRCSIVIGTLLCWLIFFKNWDIHSVCCLWLYGWSLGSGSHLPLLLEGPKRLLCFW